MEKIRVLVVDDSLVVRRVVTEELTAESDMEVVGSAANGRIALDKAAELHPDLVILDIEMPEMDGLTALTHLRERHPKTPVIMFSSLTELGAAATLEALSRGASDFFAKPRRSGRPGGIAADHPQRADSRHSRPVPAQGDDVASRPRPRRRRRARPPSAASRIDLVAIGASTGGPNALAELFAALPADFPVPILVVQHMPPMFTQMLAERLTKNSKIPTVEAKSRHGAGAGQSLDRARRSPPCGRSRRGPRAHQGASRAPGKRLPPRSRPACCDRSRASMAPIASRSSSRAWGRTACAAAKRFAPRADRSWRKTKPPASCGVCPALSRERDWPTKCCRSRMLAGEIMRRVRSGRD